MPFDPQFALSTMLPLAEAAYDLSKLSKEWTLVAPIEPCSFGFVAQGPRAAVISFRGTEEHPGEQAPDREWLEDFDGLAVSNDYGKGMVHQGFQAQYSQLRPSVFAALHKVDPKLPIWITGHSLGAALAILCQADLGNQKRKSLAHTWAGPRVGWPDFAFWFSSLGLECDRVVNEWDIVPRVPSVINGYSHVGYQVLLDGGMPKLGEQFFKTAHNLELSYRPGMERLVARSLKAA